MQNRVGSVIPSDQEIQRLVKDVNNLAAKIKKFTLRLSSEERVRTTKMRSGGEKIVELVGNLVMRNEVSLPRISVEEMKKDLTLAQRLAPLDQALANVSQTVSDTRLQAHSECWWAATAYYSALTRLSDADPQLEGELKPAVEFFARRRRSEPTPTPED